MKNLFILILSLFFLQANSQGLKISQLPVASPLTGSELTVVVQGGVTKQSTISTLPFTNWSSAVQYANGNSVIFSNNIYTANTTPTIAVNPGGNSQWTLQVIDPVAYTGNASWSGIFRAPTMNYVGNIFDALYDSLTHVRGAFLALSGGTMTGVINMGGNDITHISKLRRINGTLAIDIDNSAVFAPNGTTQILDFIGSLNMYSYINLNGFSVRKVSLLSNSSNAPVYDLDNAYLFASDGMTINVDIYNKILYGTWSATGSFTSSQYRISALNTAPSSSSDTGALGEIRITSSYIYICTATNTWVRSALTTW